MFLFFYFFFLEGALSRNVYSIWGDCKERDNLGSADGMNVISELRILLNAKVLQRTRLMFWKPFRHLDRNCTVFLKALHSKLQFGNFSHCKIKQQTAKYAGPCLDCNLVWVTERLEPCLACTGSVTVCHTVCAIHSHY